jgi:putative membrane protein
MGSNDKTDSVGRRVAARAGMALVLFVLGVSLILWLSPEDRYLWIKALHIIAVISWMAGLFYLPRLFINHLETSSGSEASEMLKGMERRLYRIIMNPAMMISWALGLYLAWGYFNFMGGWLHAKLLAVMFLTGAHVYFGRAVAAFGRDERPLNGRKWRLINEIPTVLMMVIVILVILKPF